MLSLVDDKCAGTVLPVDEVVLSALCGSVTGVDSVIGCNGICSPSRKQNTTLNVYRG